MKKEILKITKLRKVMEPENSIRLDSEALLLIMMWLILGLADDLILRLQLGHWWSLSKDTDT